MFGESLIDLIQVDADMNQSAPLYRAHPGGSPFNAALALARQGLKAGFSTPISTDSYGQLLAHRLQEMDGLYAYPERVANPTSLAVVTLNTRPGQAINSITQMWPIGQWILPSCGPLPCLAGSKLGGWRLPQQPMGRLGWIIT